MQGLLERLVPVDSVLPLLGQEAALADRGLAGLRLILRVGFFSCKDVVLLAHVRHAGRDIAKPLTNSSERTSLRSTKSVDRGADVLLDTRDSAYLALKIISRDASH